MQGREMMGWLSHLRHIRDKNVVFVGILDQRIDDYGRETFELQLEAPRPAVNYLALWMKLLRWL